LHYETQVEKLLARLSDRVSELTQVTAQGDNSALCAQLLVSRWPASWGYVAQLLLDDSCTCVPLMEQLIPPYLKGKATCIHNLFLAPHDLTSVL
jgi:hypothetical protein